MKIRELIDLGFHVNFVSAEESGGQPYFYVGFEIGDMYIISEAIEMDFEENEKKYFEGYLENQVKVSIFDHDIALSDESIKALINQKLQL